MLRSTAFPGRRGNRAVGEAGGASVTEAVAVFAVGKSNAKLALVDLASHAVLATRTTQNVVRGDGPYPHFDVERLWTWLLAGLAEFACQANVSAISTTTHRACFALTAAGGLALPILAYE